MSSTNGQHSLEDNLHDLTIQLQEKESKLLAVDRKLLVADRQLQEKESKLRELNSQILAAEGKCLNLEIQYQLYKIRNSMNQVHDALFRTTCEYLEAVYDLMCKFLPPDILQACNIKDIRQESGEHIDDYLHHTASDVVVSVPTTTEPGYRILILLEHQSTVDNNIHWRMMKYMQALIERYDAQYKIKPHVAPILFYQGDGKPYNGPLNVQDDFFPKGMRHTLATVNLTVVDLASMSDEKIMDCGKVAAMMLAMKYARKQSNLTEVMDNMVIALERLPKRLQGRSLMYINDQWGYSAELFEQILSERKILSEGKMASLTEIMAAEISAQISEQERAKGREEGREEMRKEMREEMREEMRKEVREEMREEDIAKGLEKGLEKGREESRQKFLQVAKNLLLDGMSLPKIQQYLGLSDQDVQELRAAALH